VSTPAIRDLAASLQKLAPAPDNALRALRRCRLASVLTVGPARIVDRIARLSPSARRDVFGSAYGSDYVETAIYSWKVGGQG